jgi:hypothetical protein
MSSNAKTVSYYHAKAKAIRNAKKAGVSNMHNAEAKENISNLYRNAEAAHNRAEHPRSQANANKLQELYRWSYGHWTYGRN